MPSETYAGSVEHLLHELGRIDLLIELAVLRLRAVLPADSDALRGLVISESEVDMLLAGGCGVVPGFQPATELASDALPLLEHVAGARRAIDERVERSLAAGVALRLPLLAARLGLSSFEVDALLICLAAELELKYERLYAYLQDDVTRKRPGVDLVLNLLCPSLETKLAARRHFAPGAALLRLQVLQLCDDPSQQHPTLLSKALKVDERIVDYLLEADELDSRLAQYTRAIAPRARLQDLLLPAGTAERLLLLARQTAAGAGLILLFQGPYGVGKRTTAEALCRELGLALLVVDAAGLLNSAEAGFASAVRLVRREALLRGASIYWEGFDALLADERRNEREALLGDLEAWPGLGFLAGNAVWEPIDALQAVRFVRLEFGYPAYGQRVQLWAAALADSACEQRDLDLGQLANKFRFGGGQIRDAASTARNIAYARDPQNGRVGMPDLYTACRLHSNRTLATLARTITPHYTWGDLVLPADRLQQLRELCSFVRYRALVYDDWGFDRKLALGKGLNALFAGPSGTGKTMAAEVMAGELELELYKIDLSSVVSKYIGETEKNLARIFAEAETSNAILFFDEADALFGKRSEVRSSHDRYANIETSYLLQKMEEYQGVVILATNLRKNMDDAFVRRMHVTVDFPFPDEQDRHRIWQQTWPDTTPRNPDLDLLYMAKRFDIAGGNIRNIALAATFLAAGDNGVVEMGHLVRATRREYQKMGKVVLAGEFGSYADLAEADLN